MTRLEKERVPALPYTGERMVPEASESNTYWEHIYRYRFATRFAKNKRVLDVACGEGYGSAALLKPGPPRSSVSISRPRLAITPGASTASMLASATSETPLARQLGRPDRVLRDDRTRPRPRAVPQRV